MREEDERAKLDSAEKRGVQKNQIEMTNKIINRGFDNEIIADLTDLTIEQIAKLRGEAG
jgi:hypothetical protein